MAFRFAYLVLAPMIIEQQFYLLRISVDQIIGIDHCISHFFTLTTTEFLISLFLKRVFLEKVKIPTYTSKRYRFALKLSIWKTKTKNLSDCPRYLKLFSNARINLKIPDEGLSKFFNLRARSVASIRFFHKKAF